MQISELKAFVAAYKAGSFTAAAKTCYVTRQAMSKAIANLESEVGTLFVREARGIRPTPLASEIFLHAERIVLECDLIAERTQAWTAGRVGTLTLACEANAMLTLPLGLLERYKAARPFLEVCYTLLPPGLSRDRLVQGAADAILGSPVDITGTNFELIYEGGMSAVFLRSMLSDAEAARLAVDPTGRFLGDVGMLEGRKLFAVAPNNYVERRLVGYLDRRGVHANITYEYPDAALSRAAMVSGMGCNLVEDEGARREYSSHEFVTVPLNGKDAPTWKIGLTCNDGAACASLVSDLAQFARNLRDSHSDMTRN